MNKWLVGGLVLAVVLAVLVFLRNGGGPTEEVKTAPPPAREVFHAAKPLQVVIKSGDANSAWLNRELRNLLRRGKMRLASGEAEKTAPFTLQVEMAEAARARMTLVAPDGVVERSAAVELHPDSRLSTLQNFARQLPGFLHAAQGTTDWTSFLGTQDADAYEKFLQSADELFGSTGTGFTQPPASNELRALDRLEALTRGAPSFARAQGLLALAYLSLGGKDEASLTQLAESTAQRALTADPSLADAQGALGLASLRRGEWLTATEHFDAALALDADTLPALEGSACMKMDVGHAAAALPIAMRAVALQPANIGANECLAYARLAAKQELADGKQVAAVARVQALAAILSGNIDAAQNALRNPDHASKSNGWIEPFLQAAADKHRTADALQAITLAASDKAIDAETEILAGTALRQSEFVFNRMLRLYKQKQPAPLRILWLPQTDFLRRHARFEAVLSATGVLPFWQEHGVPDVCADEPDIRGCKVQNK